MHVKDIAVAISGGVALLIVAYFVHLVAIAHKSGPDCVPYSHLLSEQIVEGHADVVVKKENSVWICTR